MVLNTPLSFFLNETFEGLYRWHERAADLMRRMYGTEEA